ncbi:DNA-binding (Roi) phage protein [Psychrobacter phage Psymv2]|uniref:anti-repressor Ant n=1 Tax=Psychrobacter phage Psymv2 TaxID=1071177 RepID=UPI00022A379F|nr:anti-repressor Ant [Psychrobacter phage Psymv2]AEO00994.1 DNA-binding (Roi) phage protein [Psychrobacter phage Psymv2]
MNILTQNNIKTMSSQQIAELVASRHDTVKKSIERIAEKGVIQLPPMTEVKNHLGQSVMYYNFTGEQGRLDSIIIVAQLSPEFTGKLVKRWDELENQVAFQIPTTLSAALRLAADQSEVIEHQQARLELAEPKAAALDVIDGAIGNINVRDTAKTLNIPQTKFINWCLAHDWLYRDSATKLQMHSQRMKQGFMKQRPATFFGSNGEVRVTMQPLFTPKGLTHLAGIFAIVHEVA